jgi:3-oxoadipate enol-lactonase
MSSTSGVVTLKDGAVFPYQLLSSPVKNAVPLLMIQGLSGSKENWLNLPVELAKLRPVAIFDNRGITRPVPEGPYSTELMASDAVAVADHLGWKQFDLFGISMGGAISQMLALNYPHRVRKLILGCTSACFTGGSTPDAARTLVPPPGKLTKEEQLQHMRESLEINLTREQVDLHPELLDEMLKLELKLKKPGAGIGKLAFYFKVALIPFNVFLSLSLS